VIQVNKHWCLLTYQVENCLFSHDLFILVRTLVNKERSKRSMIFCISCICQAFNLSSVCVSLLLDIGWFKCLRAQNGVCSSVGGKEGVLWVMLLTNGWEGLVYVFPSFLSLMHVPAYQQFGSFIVILITIVRQVRQRGGTPENVTSALPLWCTRWRSWLRHFTTSRKVAGSIPNGVTGIFH